MEYLVTYDVATESAAGRARLRRVAKVCEAHGQRVQYSVFECILNGRDLELLLHRLLAIIEPSEDSLRLYRLREPREQYVQVYGKQPAFDLHDPLVL